MSNTKTPRVTGMSIHDVCADDIKVSMTSHGWFTTVEIVVGKMPITLFTHNDSEAVGIINNFSKVTHTKSLGANSESSDMFTDSEYDFSLEPF